MPQFGGKNSKESSDSKRHFKVVMDGKEHGLYSSSNPSSAAKKAVTKLCSSNKGKKVEFYMREITQNSEKKTYGPYLGYIEKLKEPIELKGRVIKYKSIVKLNRKTGAKKGGENRTLNPLGNLKIKNGQDLYKYNIPIKMLLKTKLVNNLKDIGNEKSLQDLRANYGRFLKGDIKENKFIEKYKREDNKNSIKYNIPILDFLSSYKALNDFFQDLIDTKQEDKLKLLRYYWRTIVLNNGNNKEKKDKFIEKITDMMRETIPKNIT
jgi:hypothetical protein